MKVLIEIVDGFGKFMQVVRNPQPVARFKYWLYRIAVDYGKQTVGQSDGSHHVFGPIVVHFEDSLTHDRMADYYEICGGEMPMLDYMQVFGRKYQHPDFPYSRHFWRCHVYSEKGTVRQTELLNIIDTRVIAFFGPKWFCKIAVRWLERNGWHGGFDFPGPEFKPVTRNIRIDGGAW